MDMLYRYINVAIYYIYIEFFARFWPPLAFDRINNAFNSVSILFIMLLVYFGTRLKRSKRAWGLASRLLLMLFLLLLLFLFLALFRLDFYRSFAFENNKNKR